MEVQNKHLLESQKILVKFFFSSSSVAAQAKKRKYEKNIYQNKFDFTAG
jgi:hypothetical protein